MQRLNCSENKSQSISTSMHFKYLKTERNFRIWNSNFILSVFFLSFAWIIGIHWKSLMDIFLSSCTASKSNWGYFKSIVLDNLTSSPLELLMVMMMMMIKWTQKFKLAWFFSDCPCVELFGSNFKTNIDSKTIELSWNVIFIQKKRFTAFLTIFKKIGRFCVILLLLRWGNETTQNVWRRKRNKITEKKKKKKYYEINKTFDMAAIILSVEHSTKF